MKKVHLNGCIIFFPPAFNYNGSKFFQTNKYIKAETMNKRKLLENERQGEDRNTMKGWLAAVLPTGDFCVFSQGDWQDVHQTDSGHLCWLNSQVSKLMEAISLSLSISWHLASCSGEIPSFQFLFLNETHKII